MAVVGALMILVSFVFLVVALWPVTIVLFMTGMMVFVGATLRDYLRAILKQLEMITGDQPVSKKRPDPVDASGDPIRSR